MLKWIVLGSAIFLAACAALFSVTGIAQLFEGAVYQAGVMAAAIEIGKLASVSFLYRYWKQTPKLLKGYLLVGTATVMFITSLGIYGYLSSAYASGASEIQNKQQQISLFEAQQTTLRSQLQQNNERLNRLQTIQTQQENRVDSLIQRGRTITTQQTLIRETGREITSVQKSITDLSNRIDSLELQKTNTTNSISSTGKLGTFYYVAQTFGVSLDTVVKWFILALVLVFDPLSVSLFLAFNVMTKRKHDVIIQNKENELIEMPSVDVIESPTNESTPLPYYMQPDYNWRSDERWKSDNNAIAYYRNLGITP